jgi:hypothetical protein
MGDDMFHPIVTSNLAQVSKPLCPHTEIGIIITQILVKPIVIPLVDDFSASGTRHLRLPPKPGNQNWKFPNPPTLCAIGNGNL